LQPQCQRQTRHAKWKKLEGGWVKCNYDASHHEGNRDSGLGWIIRNSTGIFLHGGMGRFQGRATPAEAECTALLWAIQATWANGYRRIDFEGDNLTITQLLQSREATPRLHYLNTIQQWRSMFTDIRFSFRHREQNSCADILAKQALNNSHHFKLYHSCPAFLLSAVNNDCGP
ncbi:hypothetical protein CARUB_v10007509mg, partial [Capsella rubella]